MLSLLGQRMCQDDGPCKACGDICSGPKTQGAPICSPYLFTVSALCNFLSMTYTSDTSPALNSFKQLMTGQNQLGMTLIHLCVLSYNIISLGTCGTFGLSGSHQRTDALALELCSLLMRSSHTLSLEKEFPQGTGHEVKNLPLVVADD